MLLWSSQKMVFQRTRVIFFGHSVSKPPFHVLGSPSFYELYVGTICLFLKKLKMPVICFFFHIDPLALLQLEYKYIM